MLASQATMSVDSRSDNGSADATHNNHTEEAGANDDFM